MKAVAVLPGVPNSIHLRDVPLPAAADVAGERGVLVRVLRTGVDGTDRDINEGKYGTAPEGEDFLIIGHESLGEVVETSANVPDTHAPGTLVVPIVRRPGTSVYDDIGLQDMTTDDTYRERGISLLHGFLTEYYCDDYEFLVPLPAPLRSVGVLLEPLSVSEKGIHQAFEIQRRLKVWQPQRACVCGAGTIGMLAALALRLRGLDVTCYSKRQPPFLESELLGEIGVSYVSSETTSFAEVATSSGPFDLIFEATGFSPLAFEAAAHLAKNGVLLLASLTPGHRTTEVATDAINHGFVLGNKVMVGTVNASRRDFEAGVADLLKAEALYPGWLGRLLTTLIHGLAAYKEMVDRLENDRDAIKVFVQVAE